MVKKKKEEKKVKKEASCHVDPKCYPQVISNAIRAQNDTEKKKKKIRVRLRPMVDH